MGDLIKILGEHGLGAALSLAIFSAFFFLLKWVLEESAKQLKFMAEERQSWIRSQDGMTLQLHAIQQQMLEVTATNRAFFVAVTEAHKHQREEHKEMAQLLGRINGYKHD